MIVPSIEAFRHIQSPFHHMDARLKLIGLFLLLFSFAFVTQLVLLPIIFIISLTFVIISRLPFTFVFSRLKIPAALFVVIAVMVLLFTAGEPIWEMSILSISFEGLSSFLLLGIRFVSILLLVIVLFGTSSFHDILRAMYSLGLPSILADMTTFTYRYIHELALAMQKMRMAVHMRGYKGGIRRALPVMASLSGTLLLRSYEQSERVYQAMCLRGYGQVEGRQPLFAPKRIDYLWFYLFVMIAVIVMTLEFFIL